MIIRASPTIKAQYTHTIHAITSGLFNEKLAKASISFTTVQKHPAINLSNMATQEA